MRAAPTLLAAIAAALLQVGSAAAAPGVRPEGAPRPALSGEYAVEYLLGVILVMLALGAFAYLLRRVQGRAGAGRGSLRVTASLPLGGKERLMIVEVDGERLLVGVSGGGVQLVRRLSTASPTGAQAPLAAGGWLARTLHNGALR